MDDMWLLLVVGMVGAIGAAMAVGTGAAMLRQHRTGEQSNGGGGEITTARRVSLWLRVVLGAGMAVWAFGSLAAQGVLF